MEFYYAVMLIKKEIIICIKPYLTELIRLIRFGDRKIDVTNGI